MSEWKSTPGKLNAGDIGKFFGKKEGQKLSELVGEMKDLTDQDKAQLAQGFADGTLTY